MNLEYTFTRFEQACEKYPDNTAVIFLGDKFTYRNLKNKVYRFATGLSGLGVKKGDRVLLYLSNSIQMIIAYLACDRKLGQLLCSFPQFTHRMNLNI